MSARKSLLATLAVLALLLAVLPPAAGAAPAPPSGAGQQDSWLRGMLAEVQAFLSHLLPAPTTGASNGRPALRLQCDNTGMMDPNGVCHTSAAPPVRPITPQCDNTGIMDPNGSCHS